MVEKEQQKTVQKFLRCFYYIYGGKRTTKNRDIPKMFLVHLWGKKNNKKVQKFLRCFYYIYGGKRTTKNSKEIPEMFLLNERVKKYQSLLYATRKNDLLNIFYNTIYIFHTPCEKSLGESRGKSAIAWNFPYYSWFFN